MGLTVVITLMGMAVTATASYYTHESRLVAQIAQVREQYATKGEVKEQTADLRTDVKDMRQDVEQLRRGQAVQEQILREIKEGLERDRRQRSGGGGPSR